MESERARRLLDGHRGHRLVSDDVVEIRKINDTLLGTSPDITRHFIRLRGIGIVDVKTLFGVESVMYNQTIDMVIRLEDWDWKQPTTDLALMKNILSSSAIKGCLLLYPNSSGSAAPYVYRRVPQRLTIVRKKWDIMQHRNFITV